MKTLLKTFFKAAILSNLFMTPAFAANHNLTSDTILSNFGLQNLEYSYKISEHWTFGLLGASTSRHITNHGLQLKGNAYGAVVRYYIDPAFQNNTWYVAGSAMKTNYETRIISNGIEYVGKSDDTASLSAGYHWFWQSFNIALGGVLTSPSKIEPQDSSGNKYSEDFNTNIGLELKIGGMF